MSLFYDYNSCHRFQVFFNNGMSNRDDEYELCMRAENVNLPKEGFFGVSAATGGLAGKMLFNITGLYGVKRGNLSGLRKIGAGIGMPCSSAV